MSIRILYFIGIVTWLLTLVGYFSFVALNPWYWFFGVIYLIVTVYHLSNYGLNLFYKDFDYNKHQKKVKDFWNKTNNLEKVLPFIDIYLPVCGEPLEVLRNTWEGVTQIVERYRYDLGSVNVYVSDDKNNPEVKKLAQEFGFWYGSRPNAGYLKKAGNIEFLFNQTQGDYYLVFDADFRPNPNFLYETIPYLTDQNIGILQTPQSFRESKGIEYGASYLQQDFYEIIQPTRSQFNACICVGSNALYSRKAINEAGLGLVDHGEDVHTGLQVQNKNYQIKYLPINLATGSSPETVKALIKQHNRWCSSSTGMMLSGKVLKSENLNWIQKLCYHIGFLYYFQQMFNFILPFQLIVLMIFHFESINIANAVWFYPYIVWSMVLLPLSRKQKWSPNNILASTTLVYTHTITFIKRLFGISATWVPTGNIDKKDNLFLQVKILFIAFNGLYLGGVSYVLLQQGLSIFDPVKLSVTFWILYHIFTQIQFLLNFDD